MLVLGTYKVLTRFGPRSPQRLQNCVEMECVVQLKSSLILRYGGGGVMVLQW